MITSQHLDHIPYRDGNQILKGLLTRNTGKPFSGVLILPAMYGIDEEAINTALNLEKEGYIAFIADIYGEENIPTGRDEALKSAAWYKHNFENYQRRISLALNELTKGGAIQEKIAVIGYCFGGTGALEAARGSLPVAGAICIHGGLYKNPNRKNNPIQTKVLIQHPADDQTVKKNDLDRLIIEMNESNTDWQLLTYGRCKHTFTNPQSADYQESMAKRAWQHMLLFLQEVLK